MTKVNITISREKLSKKHYIPDKEIVSNMRSKKLYKPLIKLFSEIVKK